MNEIKKEIWKEIPGYEGLYQVSSLGNVKSLKFKKVLILKQFKNLNNYFMVTLHNKKIHFNPKRISVHLLVAMTFLNHKPNKTNRIVVDHINNIKEDNKLQNLQLITNRENNSKDKKNKTSIYTGVCWDKSRNKWLSCIRINNKKITLGRFKCELKASMAYKNALKKLIN
jgi:hypothetical protein